MKRFTISLYIAAAVAANLSIAHFGPDAQYVNAFLFIGFSVVARDLLHDAFGKHRLVKMAGLITTATVLSYAINPAAGVFALASATAFATSEAVDAVVYEIARRAPWLLRSNLSNVPAAVTDSVVFPTLAFGAFSFSTSSGQIVAKVAGGLVFSLALVAMRRAGRSQSLRFYLGGPINGCTDEEASGWREQVKPLLEAAGHTWIDPMVRDYRGREMEPGIAAEIVENDKDDINQCDVLLMNCPKPSVGTSMEVLYGWEQGKRVIAILPEGTTPSPWIVYHAHDLYAGSVADAVSVLA